MTDPLARVIAPIVEGQIRSFLHDHPEIAAAHAGKRRPGRTQTDALVDSIAKRIVRDLLCADTRVRLVAAALEPSTGAAAKHGGAEVGDAPPRAGLELHAGPARIPAQEMQP